jgi:hypothetical protein
MRGSISSTDRHVDLGHAAADHRRLVNERVGEKSHSFPRIPISSLRPGLSRPRDREIGGTLHADMARRAIADRGFDRGAGSTLAAQAPPAVGRNFYFLTPNSSIVGALRQYSR